MSRVARNIANRENGWDHDFNESSRPSPIRPEGLLHGLTPEPGPNILGSGIVSGESNPGLSVDVGNDPGIHLNTSRQVPIMFNSSGSSWLYTIIFVLSWVIAPILVVWSKLTGRPAGIQIPSWLRRRRNGR